MSIPEERDWPVCMGQSLQTFDASTTTDSFYPGSQTLSLNKSGDLAIFGGADGVVRVAYMCAGLDKKEHQELFNVSLGPCQVSQT